MRLQKPAEVPDDITDPMERIESAIRPTGVMKRPVRLEGTWARQGHIGARQLTQKHVSDALDALNCTRIVIAHRLSTVRHVNRIIMLEGDRIVEDGSYEDLVAAGGKFADLVASQQLDYPCNAMPASPRPIECR